MSRKTEVAHLATCTGDLHAFSRRGSVGMQRGGPIPDAVAEDGCFHTSGDRTEFSPINGGAGVRGSQHARAIRGVVRPGVDPVAAVVACFAPDRHGVAVAAKYAPGEGDGIERRIKRTCEVAPKLVGDGAQTYFGICIVGPQGRHPHPSLAVPEVGIIPAHGHAVVVVAAI
jgi:hypothetical protein